MNGSVVTVHCSGVPNAQNIAITLNNVFDGTNTGNISIPMGVLLGDVDQTRIVDGNDVSAVQSHTRQPVNNATFKFDVTVDGLIDGNDVSLTQSHTRTSLP